MERLTYEQVLERTEKLKTSKIYASKEEYFAIDDIIQPMLELQKYKKLEEQIGCPLEKAVKMLVEFQERFGTDVVDYDIGDKTQSCGIATFDEEEICCENVEQQEKLIHFIDAVNSIQYSEIVKEITI